MDWKAYGNKRSWSKDFEPGASQTQSKDATNWTAIFGVYLYRPYFISQSHLTLQPVMPGRCCFVFKYALKLSAGRTFTCRPSSPDTVALT